MTGRKWESEVDDASRYCQITRRMHEIRPFLQPVLVISLASFSLVNFTGMKVCVGGEGRRSSASRLPKTPSHSGKSRHDLHLSLTLVNCRRRFSLSIYLLKAPFFFDKTFRNKDRPLASCTDVCTIHAAILCIHKGYSFSTDGPVQERRYLFPVVAKKEKEENNGWKMNREAQGQKKTRHLHRSIKPTRTSVF